MNEPWCAVSNIDEIATPALLIFPDRIEHNIRAMVELAGGAARLRPHIKTHKMAEVVDRQLAAGVTRFKTSTIAEAELAAQRGSPDVLLAYQPVGPNIARLVRLATAYPATRFSALVDDAGILAQLSQAFSGANAEIDLLLDIDSGMHRTGVEPGAAAEALYQQIQQLPGVRCAGLHAYDGHLTAVDLVDRTAKGDAAFARVLALGDRLRAAGCDVPRIVVGGTPTFPVHARRDGVECSPGTCVLWDQSYGSKYKELPFKHAAILATRVVSKPTAGRLCLDLGYKAVSPDNPDPRVYLLSLPDARAVVHNEEHLTVESPGADAFAVGDVLYGVPWHVCPTVALHREAIVVEEGRAVGRWLVAARERALTV